MKTSQQLVDEVEAELNAVKAADMGLEAIEAFALEAEQQYGGGDAVKTGAALSHLIELVRALRKAVPANGVPASAGPVGKSPKEHMIEQIGAASEESLKTMQSALLAVQEYIEAMRKATEAATQAVVLKATAKDAV